MGRVLQWKNGSGVMAVKGLLLEPGEGWKCTGVEGKAVSGVENSIWNILRISVQTGEWGTKMVPR